MKNWEKKKLGDICNFVRGPFGGSLKKNIFKSDGYAVYEQQHAIYDQFDDIRYFIDEKKFNEMKRFELNSGDLIMSCSGTMGKIAIVPEKIKKGIINQALLKLSPSKKVSNVFLKLWMQSENFQDSLKEYSGGAAIQNVASVSILKQIEIPLPPLPEQQRIVAIIYEAFAAIAKVKANAEQNLKNAKELFDVYLHKYYASKEEGWEEKNLKEVAEYFNGLTYSPKDVSNKGIIVLRSSNVQNDELDFNDIVRVNLTVKEKIIVREGDILMCSRNGSARLVGKTATIKNLNEEMTFGTFMMIIRSQYNPYLSWFFKSTDFRNQIKGGENTMINQITRYMLDDIVLSFPPIDKQNEIVQKLNSLAIEIKKLDTIYYQKIYDLEELKKSILQKAFSGELKTNKKELAWQKI
jgi:type I restriction enzyme S subunit